MSEKIVTLAMFQNLVAAQMARNRLEAEGIRVLVLGDTASVLFGGSGLETVQLQVSEAHYPRALALLESLDHDHDELAEAGSSTAITERQAARNEPPQPTSDIQAPHHVTSVLYRLLPGDRSNLYSIYLLIRLSLLSEDMTPRGMLRIYGAVLINAVFWCFLCLSCTIFRFMF